MVNSVSKSMMVVISSEGRLCLFVRIRESEIGRNESLFNFIARRVVLKERTRGN